MRFVNNACFSLLLLVTVGPACHPPPDVLAPDGGADWEDAAVIFPDLRADQGGDFRDAIGDFRDAIGDSTRVPILCYHHVLPPNAPWAVMHMGYDLFRSHLLVLKKNGFNTVTTQDLLDALAHLKPLPAQPVMLTFDDGYDDFYEQVVPLLKEFSMKAVSFVIAGRVGLPLSGDDVFTDRPESYMTWEQMREAIATGLVAVESHTLTHMSMWSSSASDRLHELMESKRLLEEKLGISTKVLAYPYGSEGVYEPVTGSALKQAGYLMAMTTSAGSFDLNAAAHDPKVLFDVPRFWVHSGDSVKVLCEMLGGTCSP